MLISDHQFRSHMLFITRKSTKGNGSHAVMDVEILQDYLVESRELLERAQDHTLRLEGDPDNDELLASIFGHFTRLKKRFDLVLMDVQMPLMDRFEATRQIHLRGREFNGQQIPIIAMTAHALKGDRGRCIDAGMSDYLTKPISRRALCAAVVPDEVRVKP